MKNLRLIGLLMMLASSSLFVNCTSDPVAGPAGIDGTDGLAGTDGLDSTADCRTCHSKEHRDPIKAAYANSVHGIGMLQDDGSRNQHVYGEVGSGYHIVCSRCHSNEGFIDQVMTGSFNPDGYASVSSISCTGCHDMDNGHRSFNFATDGNDYSLRTLDPVALLISEEAGQELTIDVTNESDELGRSNTCVNCHQPRGAAPTFAAPDSKIMFTSEDRFGGHHGVQSTLFEGIQGAEIAGDIAYPLKGSSPHRKNSSCVNCHMSESTDASTGGHTWNPTLDACNKCHSGTTSYDRNGFQTEILANLEELEALLVDKITGQEVAVTGQDAEGVDIYEGVFEADGVTPVMFTGLSDNDRIRPGIYDLGYYQAYWNLNFITEDLSEGVHNPDYTEALLLNSIQYLENQ